MVACACDNQKFIEYRLSAEQGKKILPLCDGQFYLHMPCNPEESVPHVWCSSGEGTSQNISMKTAFSL